jgi:uncharacterized membrane protein
LIRWALAYLGAGLTMAGLDAVWLTVSNPILYRPLLDPVLMPEGLRLAPAIAFYLVYLAGLVIFAVRPGLATGRWRTAALFGGLYGFFCYATYDLTNQATLAVWSMRVTAADLAWGTALSATAATAGFLAGRRVPDQIMNAP